MTSDSGATARDDRVRRGRGHRRWLGLILIVLAVLSLWIGLGNDLARRFETSAPSRSIGTAASGRLESGKRLPSSGPNFVAYSRLGTALGRNAVHDRVRAVLLDSYAELARTMPGVTFVCGETGWPRGGRFRPHRTHQNGLSVDFMVPVRDAAGAAARLPTWPWQKFGYAIEFDADGRWQGLAVDFRATRAHLDAVARVAPRHGVTIERVIFAPEFLRRLDAAGDGEFVGTLPFMRARPWVRHDEHYHVDFALF